MKKTNQVAKTLKIDGEIWDFFQAVAERDDRSLTYVVKSALQSHIKSSKKLGK